MLIALCICSFIPLFSLAQIQSSYPSKVQAAITQSPFDRKEWKKLLDEYREKEPEKYKAACFLITNMPLHQQSYTVERMDTMMLKWLDNADNYYELVRHRSDTALCNPYFNKKILAKADQQYRKATEAQVFNTPKV